MQCFKGQYAVSTSSQLTGVALSSNSVTRMLIDIDLCNLSISI